MEALLRDRRLLYVTGKGGVGKTTVAAALGLAAAEAGRRTIVCEVAEQDRVSRAFRREGVVAETEVQLADNLWAITIDPQQALVEWLGKQLGGPALNRSGHMPLTTIASSPTPIASGSLRSSSSVSLTGISSGSATAT